MTASTVGFYLAAGVGGYNLLTATGPTNITTAAPAAYGADTSSAINIVASLTSTVTNISGTAAGCSFDVSVLSGVLP